MILLGDLGNSRQKWRLANGKTPGATERFEVNDTDGLASFFAVCAGQGVSRMVVSHVGGSETLASVARLAGEAGLPAPESVSTPADGRGPALFVGYREPARLGVDRYLAMLGARARYPQGCIVVDCGTAVTVDAIRADGNHLGGAILPGMRLMTTALARGTGQVQVEWSASDAIFGRDTVECVGIGTLHAVVAGIDALVAHMAGSLAESPVLVLTGGDAELVEPLLKARYHSHPDLVLEGLAIHAGI